MTARLIHLCLIAGVLLLPITLTTGLLSVYHGANISDLIPTDSDEVMYWHQAVTFAEAGFNGGYYTEQEVPAEAEFTRFYAWGPFIPAFYGTFGSIVGWHLNSIVWVNLTMFTLALGVWVWTVRPDNEQLILAFVLLATFMPFLLYAPRSLVEITNQGIGVAVAAGFAYLLKNGFRWRVGVALFAFIMLAGLFRLTWIMMLMPLFVLMGRGRPWWVVLLAPVGTAVILLPMLTFTGWIAAPYENFLARFFILLESSWDEGMAYMWDHLILNWQYGIFGQVPERSVFLLYGLLITLAVVTLGYFIIRKPQTESDRLRRWEALFHLANLPIIFALIFIAYDTFDWRGMRTLSPHLLTSLMVLVALRRRWLVMGVACIGLMSMPVSLSVYEQWSADHIASAEVRAQYAISTGELANFIPYDKDAPSPWCNTLIFLPTMLFGKLSVILSVPPGIGVTTIPDNLDAVLWEDGPVPSVRSQYLITTEPIRDDFPDMALIGNLGTYHIYRNTEAQCT